MPKVEFKRVETDEEVENINIKDGQLIYSKTGKTYMDDGNERIPTGSGGSSVDVDTEMSDSSENAVQNKVIKEYVDDQIEIGDTEPTSENNKIWIDTGEAGSAPSEITNEYSESIGLGYSANYVNKLMVGTVLFTGSDRTASITLNDSVANYDRVEIIYQAHPGTNCCNSVSVENPNNKKVQLLVDAEETSSSLVITLLNEQVVLSGSTLSVSKAYRCILQNNNYPNIGTMDTTSYYYITIEKVIGYKYSE